MGNYLAECIQSVLNQTYKNFEYIIVNNCSTDRTLEIALGYAKKDNRIRVHNNARFVGVMENHNIALNLISPGAKYCKVVCADDFIFPECLSRMVELAETNPSVGLVGSYSIAGKEVIFTGLEYEKKIVKGADICRATLRGGAYVLGCPTSLLYRADVIRKTNKFYPNSNPHCDTTASYQVLEESDFGFVHQVLSFTRIHAESQTSRSIKYGIIKLSSLSDFCRFGPKYLTQVEMNQRLRILVDDYYHSLVPTLFLEPKNKEFWQRQQTELAEIGMRFSKVKLLKAAFFRVVRFVLKPGVAQKVLKLKRNPGQIEARYYEQDPSEDGDRNEVVHA
jgi:glycosyltransferase involved in cell wall biosynthesis